MIFGLPALYHIRFRACRQEGHGHELSLDTHPFLIEELIGMVEKIKEKSYSLIDSWLDSGPWKKGRRIGLTGLAGSSKAYLLTHWREKVRGPLLVIVPHLRGAEVFLEDLRFFMRGSEVPSFLFPQWETLPYDEIPPHPEIIQERVRVLFSLLKEEEAVIVSSIKALMQKVLAPADLRESVFSLSVGEEVDRDRLVNFLHEAGYTSTKVVEERGDFSVRGGIIDLYTPFYEEPLRLEFDGDRLESIRRFDKGWKTSRPRAAARKGIYGRDIVLPEGIDQIVGDEQGKQIGLRPQGFRRQDARERWCWNREREQPDAAQRHDP